LTWYYCQACSWSGTYTQVQVCALCDNAVRVRERRGNTNAQLMEAFPDQQVASTIAMVGGLRALRELATALRLALPPAAV
jgi:aryl-alcohol dehydrogenase-like predicted oxidoreductase